MWLIFLSIFISTANDYVKWGQNVLRKSTNLSKIFTNIKRIRHHYPQYSTKILAVISFTRSPVMLLRLGSGIDRPIGFVYPHRTLIHFWRCCVHPHLLISVASSFSSSFSYIYMWYEFVYVFCALGYKSQASKSENVKQKSITTRGNLIHSNHRH